MAELEGISSTLSSMLNDYSSDDFYLLEGRKLSMYETGDVVVQIDGYAKKGISEEYGNVRTVADTSGMTPFKRFLRVSYSIAGAVAFFSFLIFSMGGGSRSESRSNYTGQLGRRHSNTR